MYAIIDAKGHQYKVNKGDDLTINRIKGEVGQDVVFEKVLMIGGSDNLVFGDPVIKGASVKATIKNHPRGDKINVFKFKRRKNYKRLKGHRQLFTTLEIKDILT